MAVDVKKLFNEDLKGALERNNRGLGHQRTPARFGSGRLIRHEAPVSPSRPWLVECCRHRTTIKQHVGCALVLCGHQHPRRPVQQLHPSPAAVDDVRADVAGGIGRAWPRDRGV